jgi:hypothetical protein
VQAVQQRSDAAYANIQVRVCMLQRCWTGHYVQCAACTSQLACIRSGSTKRRSLDE